ncbi:hypothetical protein TNCV_958611 [Trichonephila clavipes]|nr:hypothetical protein TNCV_958611 [Trichonephila clavipes]
MLGRLVGTTAPGHHDCSIQHLRFDIFEPQEAKLPVRLIDTTNERRLVQGHGTPPRVKDDIEDISSKLDNGGLRLQF